MRQKRGNIIANKQKGKIIEIMNQMGINKKENDQ